MTPTPRREPAHRQRHSAARRLKGRTVPRRDAFALLGVAPSFVRVLRYFAVRPGARPHLRELQRVLGLASASAQRDLAQLVDAGLVQRVTEESGRIVRYAVVPEHPHWGVVRALVRASTSPADLLREALRDLAGVEAAFLFGSSAAGTERPDSDVDVLVVGDAVDMRALHRNLFEVGQLLGREVNAVRYTRTALAERLAAGARFVREVLEGPKSWLAGDPQIIAPIAIAASVHFDTDVGRWMDA